MSTVGGSDDALDQMNFSDAEIHRLFKRFLRIDVDQSGELDLNELLRLEKIAENPLVHRLLELFDTNKNGSIDFNEFLTGLSIFSRPGNIEKKILFLFKLYDHNNDGIITNGDLFNSLKSMVGDNLNDVQLQQIVDKTFRDVDTDVDGKISFEEFKTFVNSRNGPIFESVSIHESL